MKGVLFLMVTAVFAQRLEFDVSSVRPTPKEEGGTVGGVGNGGGGGRNVTVKALIAFTYRVQDFQVLGGPRWLATERYNVEGKTERRDASPTELRAMLQSLLEDRFQLRLHRETRPQPVYELRIGKRGLRMQPSADQLAPDVNGPSRPGAGPNRGAIRMTRGRMIGNAVAMDWFARNLSQRLDRTVVDRTGLNGRWDISLEWTPGPGESHYNAQGNPVPDEGLVDGPSIFTVLKERLGLTLTNARAPVEVLVIDAVERPDPN
jgi:uncharacterized protein (TIGR03435 family)